MIIIKVGGDKKNRLDYVACDIKKLWDEKNGRLIVVHGASQYRNHLAAQLKVEIKKIISSSGVESYYSDDTFMDVFLMAYAGLVNKKLVAQLIKNGVPRAIGLSGVDGSLVLAERKKHLFQKIGRKIKLIPGDKSGKIISLNLNLLKTLINHGYLPVITSPAISIEGEILNVDNDAILLFLIKEFQPKTLIYLIGEKGFLKNPNDPDSLIKRIDKKKLDEYSNFAFGTMKKKIIYAKKYFELGLERIYLGDGRVREPIRRLLIKGEGTIIS